MTVQEFFDNTIVTKEAIQRSVLEFLVGRTDTIICGAWAVNLYCPDAERQTVDIDIIVKQIDVFAPLLIKHLESQFSERFTLADFAVWHKGRRVVDLCVPTIDGHFRWEPPEIVNKIQVVEITQLLRMKAIAAVDRKGTAKGMLDLADILLLLAALRRQQKIGSFE